MSARALRNILPHLMAGLGYADACTKAGYNHSNSFTNRTTCKLGKIQDKLELYTQKITCASPVVEKIIVQVTILSMN